MPRWVHHLLQSRAAGIAIVGLTGVTVLGSCGGMLLANYTVQGTAIAYYGNQPATISEPRPRAALSEQAAQEVFGDGATTQQASYAPDAGDRDLWSSQ